jgi:hypothetical protein
VKNWNATEALPAQRYLLGSAQESSVMFMVGGYESASVPATDTVFWNNY